MINEPKSTVTLRSVRGRSVRDVVAESMERCGWEQIVPRDALVVVKPNLCTAVPDKAPSSNTDPAIAEAVCEILLTRTKRVIMGESDGLRQKAQEAFAVSGYVEIGRASCRERV